MEIILECGDCIEIMNKLPDKSIDGIFCDPPYGQTARNKWDVVIPFDSLWNQYTRIIKDNGVICLFANGMFTSNLMQSNKKMWRYNLIWHKTTPTGFFNAKRMPLRSHKDICVFYKKLPVYNPVMIKNQKRKISTAEHKKNCKVTYNYGEYSLKSYDSTERYPTSVVTFASDRQKCALHDTQKPLALMEWLIITYTNAGDTVLDNCMGSGTTGVAAKRLNRNFIGIEKERHFYNIAADRILTDKYRETHLDL